MNAESFRDWMALGLAQMPLPLSEELHTIYWELALTVNELLLDRRRELWKELPEVVRSIMTTRGWRWNGIYENKEDKLVLKSAAGPPVCHELPIVGGLGTSGMCYDSLTTNQTLVASHVEDWPGYVSCDGESGLATVAGLVCPVRDLQQHPVAIWDLDSTRELDWAAPLVMDRLISTLCLIKPWGTTPYTA